MELQSPTCALLADRHTVLAEGIRGLLETTFKTVYLVADAQSLREGTQRLSPAVIVLDISLVGENLPQLLHTIRDISPKSRVIVLTVHDEASVAQLALDSGAHSVVLKRCVASDFNAAIDAVLRGEEFVSPDFGLAANLH